MTATPLPATAADGSFGALLRAWRTHRRWSQQELSTIADVSARHLSFLETGRSRPSREMVLTLTEHLDVPLRERNELLVAAGHAPAYPRRDYRAPELAVVRDAVDRILASHAPLPAVAVDRRWDIVAANPPMLALVGDVAAHLLEPPINVHRLTLHPQGLAPRLVNFAEVAHHLLDRLRRDLDVTGDRDLAGLVRELEGYPDVRALPHRLAFPPEVVVPVRLRHPRGEIALFTTVTTFGTPADVTVAELALELFYPLDATSAERLTALVAG